MIDLPWVKNDLQNARSTVQMMGIQPENIVELIDKTYDDIQSIKSRFNNLIIALTRKLDDKTKLCFTSGPTWSRIKEYYMKNDSDPDSLFVSSFIFTTSYEHLFTYIYYSLT